MNTRIFSLVFVFVAAFLMSCNQGNEEVSTDAVNVSASATEEGSAALPAFSFEKEVHDFGRITQGEKVSHSFKFTNTGEAEMIISDARAGCGCTIPNYPKDPIAPGEEGIIDVTFNSEGKSGKTEKTITIVANTEPNTHILKIKTEIVQPETEE